MDQTELSSLLQRLAAATPEGAFVLEVVEGPETGTRFEVNETAPGGRFLGTSPAASFRLTDSTVSRRHCSIEQEGRTLRLRDLDSTNGTHVDHLQIRDASLQGGELVRIGHTTLRVHYLDSRAHQPVVEQDHFGRLLGTSRAMRRLYPLAQKLADAKVPVIIEGETGTGKEVLAEAIHEQGARSDRPFVVFDCTTVPANMMEAELFGHERGAFTGAVGSRRGFFEQAHGGTLLIDEIGDLELPLQAKLLRAVERGEVRRIGAERAKTFDVRVMAATRRDLDHEIQAGRFRDDLFHRLAVGRIELPPLRERLGDVRFLALHLWSQMGGREPPRPQLLAKWEAYGWPGNVRELRNAVARAVELGEEPELQPLRQLAPTAGTDFLDEVLASESSFVAGRRRLNLEFERRYLERVLAAHGGNVSRAAAASGLARRHFQRLNSKRQSSA